ncbi:TonB-dependent receptor plug domain-containing protein [Pseudoalteromonas aurantia]|uniref:Ferrienterochelin and colicins outer membrane receptor n=1 Tax=Pseudoalteromonas aurantia 208 TaxID=1314867 RepID=A0ABR9EB04_9GAMM|nr:TonB-dependent receptor [Pseudoalteromonas aurantia]MBE0368172.1 ferrienterochelin and colicins outer membrane receptor [Pseudoalteromonas aurantia 208]
MLPKYTKLATAVLLIPSLTYASEQHNEHGHHEHEQKNIEKIQVTASRLGRIVTESATRTEIINGEEIQEKALMRPGNISMLVAETGGVRVQNTSPALGSANIRLQGLFGRYTQLLSDGLPLYGGQTASIGLLQIPPTDLANVEIIKGSASSLYGGSALGGVINLISRTPSDKLEGEVLLNATSKNGQDITSYFASPLTDSLSASVTAGLHHQQEQDLDDDGWIDLAGYKRASVRPRLYWYDDSGANLYLTFGAMTEQREGGTLPNATVPDGNFFLQTQDTLRVDSGFVFDKPLDDDLNMNMRGSLTRQEHQHEFGQALDDDTHESYLIESSLSGYHDATAWVIGVAYQADKFDSIAYPEFDYHYEVPGLFSQLDYDINPDTAISLSARTDWHNEYGTQVSPRISVLYNPENWLFRGSYGQGFFAPTPFIEDIEDAGLSRLASFEDLNEERASTASLDISYILDNIETSVTLFASDIEDATELHTIEQAQKNAQKQVRIINAIGQSKIRGAELLLRYRWRDIKFTGSYLYTDASKQGQTAFERTTLALTPAHSAGLVVMWEEHGSHLLGFEAYYTGTQHLEGNPYRDKSDAYWHLGLLGQITLGHISWFINAENLLNIRQTKEDTLILPEQSPSGRWTTDIWSRNDGFTVNAGVRIQFGG